ncbi:aspartate/glutamate racemase [Microbacterium trichothecenolyticum]|uniref:aspartate/glutamate racemase family protein n=1 Tax=Microbacterium trichothecenolyticum TaxID=69370 RepID=UPI0028582431|nr:aspartate/glutamate racemase family protein [Microbacterium trichothecenolyticum]MDR7183639.1 aspartate/glutamate racemase [Microbacterium trichothecenolyticum]
MSSSAPRIAFLHTGAVNIAPFGALAAEFLPGATVVNYLDDRIVADLGDEARADSVPERIDDLVRAAAAGGADAVMFTCSSISELAAPAAAVAGVPVLRVDEAMADAAVRSGRRIRVLATLPTTCRPTLGLLQERAALAGVDPEFTSEVIEGAFAAVAGGDRPTHDRLVAAAIERGAAEADVIVLAQASMASAAEAVSVDVPVLTSPRLGVERLAESLSAD